MTEQDSLDQLRSDLDYNALIDRASPALRLYIRTLEQENARLRQEVLELRQHVRRRRRSEEARTSRAQAATAAVATVRHPDDVMVVSITAKGLGKRTPLNEYSTQRRGGVGVFDIQSGRDDPARHVLVARAQASLLFLTNRGRAFRVAVDTLPLAEVRGRGASLPERLMLTDEESLGAVLALDDEQDPRSAVLFVTANGWVRTLHRNYVGPRLQPGTLLYDPKRGGPAAAMALSDGQDDVLIALRSGQGIRFSQHLIRREGVRGIQVKPGDTVVGITAVADDSTVLMVSADGKGAKREMGTFRANKSPGAQGKSIMKTEDLAALATVVGTDEVLCLSGFAKIIRFAAEEVPIKAGSVQGVAVLDCRGDHLTAMTVVSQPA